jgi:precorrin isomerase/sirohydrochlorin ferrochelatase
MKGGNGLGPTPREPHPIETESRAIVESRLKLDGWTPGAREVVTRVVHATGDPDLVRTMVVPEAAVVAGVAAIRSGAAVVCDVEMVAAGVRTELAPECRLRDVKAAPGGRPTRSALAAAVAAAAHPRGAVFVVGCAPTALDKLCDLIEAGDLRPALVIGTPVGFVGAAESKARLRQVSDRTGVASITNVGERGGSSMAAAVTNALADLAARPSDPGVTDEPTPIATHSHQAGTVGSALFLIGHGTRSDEGFAQFNALVDRVSSIRPAVLVGSGLIEFAEPDIDTGIDVVVAQGAKKVVAVPVVLLGAGHMKNDGPDGLRRARERHPDVDFSYARDLGVHPVTLEVAEERAREAGAGAADAVVMVGRGSSDPDANSDLAKVARLLADHRGLGTRGDASQPLGIVEPAFISLAPPDVSAALDRCYLLGARKITLGLYFLFTGVLPRRAADEARAWADRNPDVSLDIASELVPDERIADLVWHRYDEASQDAAAMNCDLCIHRVPLPGYEGRVGEPIASATGSYQPQEQT